MAAPLTEQIRQYMQENDMLSGGKICIGLSGGADSVFLLHVLLETAGRNIMAAHINHMLRSAESDGDEAFVRGLCAKLDVPLHVEKIDVAEKAAVLGTGLEEAGRAVRHEVYAECAEKYGAREIALAHHANDLAETFVFNAARGSSIAGLAGIRPVQLLRGTGARIIRPILFVTRREITEWLSARGLEWREDSTNAEDGYTRNGIRHNVIPYLEENVNARAVAHIADAAQDAAMADEFIRGEAVIRAARYTDVPEGVHGTADETHAEISLSQDIMNEPELIRGYIMIDALEKVCGSRKDLGREQIRQLTALLRGSVGKHIDLPYGAGASRTYDGIVISGDRTACAHGRRGLTAPGKIRINTSGSCSADCGGWHFEIRSFDANDAAGELSGIPHDRYTKWFDYDKIGPDTVLRARESGDHLIIDRAGRTKKLNDYLIDEKVPAGERDSIPVLADGSRVIWVIGHRISEDVKITEGTKRILEVKASHE